MTRRCGTTKGPRPPVRLTSDDYLLDNRDDRLTEIHIDRGNEYLIIGVCPQDLMRDALENLPLPAEMVTEFVAQFNDLTDYFLETTDDWIEENDARHNVSRRDVIDHLIEDIEDYGFSLEEFARILQQRTEMPH